MSTKRKIEVFSAGCPICEGAIALINRIACSSCEITILDMHDPGVASKAQRYGVTSVPAVAVDGNLADCCVGRGPDEGSLRAAGIGTPP